MFGISNNSPCKVINVNDMDGLLGKVELIDIREPYEYEAASLKGSKNIPMGILLKEPSRFMKKGIEYYIMCQSGGRSADTCKKLSNEGYDVINVTGGMGSYVGTRRN